MLGFTTEVMEEVRANLKRQADNAERTAIALEAIADTLRVSLSLQQEAVADPAQLNIPGM